MSCLASTRRRPKLSVKYCMVSLEQRYSVVAPVSQRVQEARLSNLWLNPLSDRSR